MVCSSAAGSKILTFGSHSLANFKPILYFFIPNFKLKYENSENIEADRAKDSCLQLTSNQVTGIFWDTRYTFFCLKTLRICT